MTMGIVVTCGCIVLALHAFISKKFPTNNDLMHAAAAAKAKRIAKKKEASFRAAAGSHALQQM